MSTIDKTTLRLTGKSGRIRCGYQLAADVGSWEIVGGVLGAELTAPPSHRLRQPGLTFEMPANSPVWMCRLVGVAIVGNRLTAHVESTS